MYFFNFHWLNFENQNFHSFKILLYLKSLFIYTFILEIKYKQNNNNNNNN